MIKKILLSMIVGCSISCMQASSTPVGQGSQFPVNPPNQKLLYDAAKRQRPVRVITAVPMVALPPVLGERA